MIKKIIPLLILLGIVIFFFKPFFIQKLLPIPSDTIVGLYYPFRDLYAATNPRGIPYHNFLITDPVRQEFPWRNLSIFEEKKIQLPLWNPYSFAGVPLFANGQSAPFYPLNILFFLLPFVQAWSLLIILEPLLGGIFLYFYLKNLSLRSESALLGSIAFAFSGFFTAWMEWGTVIHVALWLPLTLLAMDKIFSLCRTQRKLRTARLLILWSIIFVFSMTASFLAGHLQTTFYLLIVVMCYVIARIVQFGFEKKSFFLLVVLFICFFALISIKAIELYQFISISARDIDQNWHLPGWFIPWQNLLQFVAPDFFGNPSTGNYWGIWNYAEFLGYIGIIPLLFSFFAMSFRHDRKTFFFGSLFFLSLIFALPTVFAKIPFRFSIPFLSTAQPTRLLFVSDFSLAILSALGLDYFTNNLLSPQKEKKHVEKKILYPIVFLGIVFAGMWVCVQTDTISHLISASNIIVTKHNLILPTILFIVSSAIIISIFFVRKKIHLMIIIWLLIAITVFDVVRFSSKFETFASASYLFPQTKILNYLEQNAGINRVMATDDQIFPPNFSVMYHIQTIDGYDPLYLKRYAELIAAMGRMKPDITPPFGFNRIISPHSYQTQIIDILGVKYILSLNDITDPNLKMIMQDGQTHLYENTNVLQRIFFVPQVINIKNKQASINKMFDVQFNPRMSAVVMCSQCSDTQFNKNFSVGSILSTKYSENKISLSVSMHGDGFLVLTDSYYPTWHATIDGKQTKIYLTDYAFRGIIIPKGTHDIRFYDSLF